VQGDGEARTKLYENTAREHWSWQRSNEPKATRATGFACWQGGGARVWEDNNDTKTNLLLY
jgi:uncharacterized protein YfaQ (DUF2300 family)